MKMEIKKILVRLLDLETTAEFIAPGKIFKSTTMDLLLATERRC